LSGCGGAGPSQDGQVFIGGIEGLTMSFIAGAPRAEVNDAGQDEFAVGIQLENLGESDVGREAENSDNYFASIEIVGLDPAQFSNPIMYRTFDYEDVTLLGARRVGESIITGGKGTIFFEGFNYLPDVFGNQDHTVRANLCYDYTTYSNTKVCIKDNPQERVEDNGICTLAGAKEVKNSGAPVAVTSLFEQPMGKDKIGVTFTIENVGTGKIFRRSSEQNGDYPCIDPYSGNNNYNKVWVKVSFPDDQNSNVIDCKNLRDSFSSNEGEVSLYEGAPATVMCTILTDPSKGQVYTSVLNIDLKYTYQQAIQQPLIIRDVSAGSDSRR